MESTILWLMDKILLVAQKVLKKRCLPSKKADSWLARLNEYFENDVHIYKQYYYKPNININGSLEITPEQKSFADKKRRHILSKKPPGINDPHAVLVSSPIWEDDPVQLEVKTLDYAILCALRNSDLKPEIISANALILCRERNVLILHRRSENSATYPRYLHTLGGAYWPPGVNEKNIDKKNLFNTVFREVFEESQIKLNMDEEAPMLIMKEFKTGFIQLVLLGTNISKKQLESIEDSAEGQIDIITFDNLKQKLIGKNRWVPTGKASVLAWLALGAPNAGHRAKFGGKIASKLFDEIVPKFN